MPDRDAHRDMGDRFTKNAFSRCATAFPHVADCFRFLVPAAAATVPIRATRRWTGGPPCFWPWFGRVAVACVHSAAPPPRGV